jgi:hypothetical protein
MGKRRNLFHRVRLDKPCFGWLKNDQEFVSRYTSPKSGVPSGRPLPAHLNTKSTNHLGLCFPIVGLFMDLQASLKLGNGLAASGRLDRLGKSAISIILPQISRILGSWCARSFASSDSHSKISMKVPSCAFKSKTKRSVTSPSLRSVGTWFCKIFSSSSSLPGCGRYSAIAIKVSGFMSDPPKLSNHHTYLTMCT